MSNLLEDRERAAEWAFAHEGEVRFLMHCSALRALAAHAAARMDLDQPAAESYARDLVADSVNGVKDEAIIERVRLDLDSRGITETAESLRELLKQYLAKAVLDSRATDAT